MKIKKKPHYPRHPVISSERSESRDLTPSNRTSLHSKTTYRYLLNLISLVAISLFFIFSPVVGQPKRTTKPVVKAAFISEPLTPVSQGKTVPSLTAKGIFVMDLDTGTVLYDKNPHLQLKPASLTKIMTSLVAIDYFNPDTVLKVKNGQNSVGNTAKLLKGDQLNASDVIYALLVPSGNDAAVTLAENYPGGYRAYIERMNQKAAQLGLKNTHFVNVSGIESPNHYTTAYDIAMIARSALHRLQFAQVVSTKNITIKSLKGNLYSLVTTNLLLGRPDILGVKTGWTPEAGECLVILASRNGHGVLLSLLGSKDRFGESKKLIDWAYSNHLWQ